MPPFGTFSVALTGKGLGLECDVTGDPFDKTVAHVRLAGGLLRPQQAAGKEEFLSSRTRQRIKNKELLVRANQLTIC
jgi:hypothetical protein